MLLVTKQRLDSLKRQWDQRYNEIKEYIERNDRYPSSEDDFLLYKWVSNQKLYYQKKRLSEDRIAKLSDLKKWEWNLEKKQNKWMVKYQLLKQFVNIYNRYPKSISNEYGIGLWVARQRHIYKENRLSEERIRLLSELAGWKWNIRETWENKFDKLREFISTHKRLPVCNIVEENEIYRWCTMQQLLYDIKKLAIDRQMKLETLLGWKW